METIESPFISPAAMATESQHPLLSLVAALFWVLLWLLTWIRSFVAFATISVPRLIYSILSYSLTFTLNFWSFVIIFVASAVALNYWIRFRYLNVYTKLKEAPLTKPDAKELHPDVNSVDSPLNFHNYLDEFLQAVRIFGFLEKPVFHELARHLQTRRLLAGDSLSLDQDKSFYCVIDGLVQVYAPTTQNAEQHGTLDGEDTNGYQLLNEVGTGGTLSSLFAILSLFTEDVQMSWQSGDPSQAGPDPDTLSTQSGSRTHSNASRSPLNRTNSDVSTLSLELEQSEGVGRRSQSASSTGSTVHAADPGPLSPDSWLHSPSEQHSEHDGPSPRRPNIRSSGGKTAQAFEHGTVIRAMEDTTLAVIPAEAFRRLTKKFPKAAAHIVQVILIRFSRVTFNAAHKYLGLTTEVLRTEKAINDIACHPLPGSFYESGGLQQLRQRFDHQLNSDNSAARHDYFSSKPASAGNFSDAPITDSPLVTAETPGILRASSSRLGVHAGDLLTSTGASETYRPTHRSANSSSKRTRSPENPLGAARLPDDDFNLRDEVMSCIAKSIGLMQPPMSGSDSLEDSPPLGATSDRGGLSRAAIFNSSFGSLSLLQVADDASSITGPSSVSGAQGQMSALDNEVEILFFPAGSVLVHAGEHRSGMFYVIDGFLDISIPAEDIGGQGSSRTPKAFDKEPAEPRRPSDSYFRNTRQGSPTGQQHLFTVKPGGIAGYLASLCGISSYVDIVAKTDAYVGFLPHNALERLLEKRPIVQLTLAKRLITLLSPLVLHIDASLDWVQVNAGQVLWRVGDESDSFYIVINGRLRAIDEKEGGKVTIVGEYGQGDSVGELDVITNGPRRYTVHAIRDTELVRMPLTLFNAVSSRNPQTTARLLRTIASRVREEVDSLPSTRSISASELGRNNLNLKTIAILPVSRNVPIEAFSRKLESALEHIGAPTSYLNQASVSRQLGRHAFTKMGNLKVAGWLAEQEQRYRTVLYVADSPVSSPWTQTCIRQADCIMIVGMGDDPGVGEYERLLLSIKTTARKELILLHPDRLVVPGSTREWLKNRPWVHQHIHIELPGLVLPVSKAPMPDQDPAAVRALKDLKDKVQSELNKIRGGRDRPRPLRPPHMNDFARLARRICGRSVGIVLGGGGARGISHLGALRAMEEYGIPIDHIGGTSIGAFVGGLYAREGSILSSAARIKQFSGRMGNIWRILSDVTYPIVAYTTGHEFNRSIYKALYDLHIEDMWLPYFCNTTNILTSKMEIHETGYAWRYIRASMTLIGLLPPLCDNGNMLVDGGYMDNLPVSAMFAMGPNTVFAVDVGSIDDTTPRNFGDTVSGWWLLLNRWNPFSNSRMIPPITEIQGRLAYVSSVRTLEEAKVARGCLYLKMPVEQYGTLQFSKFEEIQEKGYNAAMEALEKWDKDEKLPTALELGKELIGRAVKRGKSLRRNSI